LNLAASPWYAIDAYSTYHFTGLQASGSSALLSFVSNRDSAYFLDNVSVNQEVPEPTTLAAPRRRPGGSWRASVVAAAERLAGLGLPAFRIRTQRRGPTRAD